MTAHARIRPSTRAVAHHADAPVSRRMPTPARQFHDRRATPRPEGVFSGEAYLPWHQTLRRHWLEYLIEALFLALFVLSAGVVAMLREDPLLRDALPSPQARAALAGLAMGLVAVAMIYSPWGRRSGTHLNPAMTLAFWRLRKVGHWDLLFYAVAQFAGGVLGIAAVRAWLAPAFAAAGTIPLPHGDLAGLALAFALELVLSAAAMLVILLTINHAALYRWTGVVVGVIVALVATWQPPLSAFGVNPARTVVVSLADGRWDAAALGLLAPVLGMLLAVDAYRLLTGREQIACAKLAHNLDGRCIFRCQHPDQARVLALKQMDRQLRARRS
jgi:aquaporin Z